MEFPEGLRYTKDHEWVRKEGDLFVVGITDFAQGELGDIVYVELETLGEELEAEATFGTIEAVKTVSDLFLPLAGTIEEINEDLEDAPELVNEDCYNKGWLIKFKATNPEEFENLMDVASYKEEIGV